MQSNNRKQSKKQKTNKPKTPIQSKSLLLGGVMGNETNAIVSLSEKGQVKFCYNAIPDPPLRIGITTTVLSSGNVLICGEKKVELANQCFEFDLKQVN